MRYKLEYGPAWRDRPFIIHRGVFPLSGRFVEWPEQHALIGIMYAATRRRHPQLEELPSEPLVQLLVLPKVCTTKSLTDAK